MCLYTMYLFSSWIACSIQLCIPASNSELDTQKYVNKRLLNRFGRFGPQFKSVPLVIAPAQTLYVDLSFIDAECVLGNARG